MMDKMNCKDCEYLKGLNGVYGSRKSYYCEHPEAYPRMSDYCREHKINKMPEFICYGDLKNKNAPTLKTSPKYCPIKLIEAEKASAEGK